MASNGPISVSAPSTSLRTASGKNITFNTRYPFHKLDSTNTVSFQVITIFLNVEPPNPDGVSTFYQRNLVYSFPHGYKYVPSTWFLVSVDNFTTALGSEGVWLPGGNNGAESVLVATADSTNINFYVDKYWQGAPFSAPSVLGTFITIRSYVFVNDLSGTDVPTQA